MHPKRLPTLLRVVCLPLKALLFLAIIFTSSRANAEHYVIPISDQSRQDIYARLEVVVSNTANYGDDHVWFLYHDVSLKIQFFSDAACTQPYTLTSALDYKIERTGTYETLSSMTTLPKIYIEGTAPSGVSEWMAEEFTVFDETDTSYDGAGHVTSLSKYVYDYQLVYTAASDYIVVEPVVYPTHP
ncbi:MAG TPA: hypothetical protein VF008_03210 [Niastella sp.]